MAEIIPYIILILVLLAGEVIVKNIKEHFKIESAC